MVLIQLDDHLIARYQRHAQSARVPFEKLIERQLARFADTPVTQRVLALTGDSLQQIESLLGVGSTGSPESLLAAIRAFAGITIGDIRLAFSPSQLDEIAIRAEKQGRTPEEVVRELVDQISRDLFYAPVPYR
jgi:hypothetical protein